MGSGSSTWWNQKRKLNKMKFKKCVILRKAAIDLWSSNTTKDTRPQTVVGSSEKDRHSSLVSLQAGSLDGM